MGKVILTVEATIQAPVSKVWEIWTTPAHIMQWNHASDDWHCPAVSNNLSAGGDFSYTMSAKDGSVTFDFAGRYTRVDPHKVIQYTISDGRNVEVTFSNQGDHTHVVEYFEAEDVHSPEIQIAGWQMILNNLKKYTETLH